MQMNKILKKMIKKITVFLLFVTLANAERGLGSFFMRDPLITDNSDLTNAQNKIQDDEIYRVILSILKNALAKVNLNEIRDHFNSEDVQTLQNKKKCDCKDFKTWHLYWYRQCVKSKKFEKYDC